MGRARLQSLELRTDSACAHTAGKVASEKTGLEAFGHFLEAGDQSGSFLPQGAEEGSNFLPELVPLKGGPIRADGQTAEVEIGKALVATNQMSAYRALSDKNPRSVAAAKAIESEACNMETNRVFKRILKSKEDVPLEHRGIILPTFLFVVDKFNAEGEYLKTKCRCVVNGKKQVESQYDQSASPVMNQATLKLMIAHAALMGWQYRTYDIACAFCLADLTETIFVSLPNAWHNRFGGTVGEVGRRLYGLRQAPLVFYETLADVLMNSLGMTRASYDPGLFVMTDSSGEVCMLAGMHVDDLLATYRDVKYCIMLKDALVKRYEEHNVKETVDPQEILGMGIRKDEATGSITLTQTGYVASIFERFEGLAGSRKESCPHSAEDMRINVEEPWCDPLNEADFEVYRQVVGCLGYAIHTHTIVAVDVAFLQTAMGKPTKGDLKKALRVLRYLYQHREQGVTFPGPPGSEASLEERQSRTQLWGSCDASYNCHSDGKGHTGIVMSLGAWCPPVFVSSSKQKIMSNSSTLAEYISYSTVAKVVTWLRGIVADMGLIQLGPTLVLNDNQAALDASCLPFASKGIKHAPSSTHHFKYAVDEEILELGYENTKVLPGDMTTKPTVSTTFRWMDTFARVGLPWASRPVIARDMVMNWNQTRLVPKYLRTAVEMAAQERRRIRNSVDDSGFPLEALACKVDIEPSERCVEVGAQTEAGGPSAACA